MTLLSTDTAACQLHVLRTSEDQSVERLEVICAKVVDLIEEERVVEDDLTRIKANIVELEELVASQEDEHMDDRDHQTA